jgi:hypothetical protein
MSIVLKRREYGVEEAPCAALRRTPPSSCLMSLMLA